MANNKNFWANQAVEPKRQYKFIVEIGGGNGANKSISSFYATKVTRPGVKIGETSHKFLNHTFYYPGVVEFDPVSISFVDPGGDNDVTHALYLRLKDMGWQVPTNPNRLRERTVTKDSSVAAFSKIKIKTLASTSGREHPQKNTVIQETWTLNNAWPTDIKWGELDYSGDGMLSLDVTFRYDWAENALGDVISAST